MSNKTPTNHVTLAPATQDDKENASTPAYKTPTKHFTHTPAAPKTQTLPHVIIANHNTGKHTFTSYAHTPMHTPPPTNHKTSTPISRLHKHALAPHISPLSNHNIHTGLTTSHTHSPPHMQNTLITSSVT